EFNDSMHIYIKNKDLYSAFNYALDHKNIEIINALLSYVSVLKERSEEEKIYTLSLKNIESNDVSLKYAALSCLNELFLKSTNEESKIEYKKSLKIHESFIATEINNSFAQTSIMPDKLSDTIESNSTKKNCKTNTFSIE